jgi:hypothetical protein
MMYFRSTQAAYESIRLQLDAAWGYPNAETKTQTAIPPVASLPSDQQGRVYLAVPGFYAEYEAVAAMLPTLLAGGQVEEVTMAQYLEVLPKPVPGRYGVK